MKLIYDILKIFNKSRRFKLKNHNRQISKNDKKNTYDKANVICESCKNNIRNYKEAEYHHIIRHKDGGLTELGNIKVLCKSCHKKIHIDGYKKTLRFKDKEYMKILKILKINNQEGKYEKNIIFSID